ncbi:uncharacterized protein LOC117601454 [Osmia lignaria lignaria]|uniref:uncharacterized protein LOC117601454 n=1 Tax=Osmia lignaria lignaria TaxID=1437193 RepID=UPI00402B912C
MLTSTKPKTKYEQSVTPLTHPKNHFKLPSRKLWEEGSSNSALKGDHWKKYRDSNKWDLVETPQFIDFSSTANIEDSYFDKVTVIVSTPNVNLQYGNLPNTFEGENSLIAKLDNFHLSTIKHDVPTDEVENNENDKENKEEYVVHKSSLKTRKDKNEICNKINKTQKINGFTAIKPFTFDMRYKYNQQRKQERINKMLEEEKKVKVFRANPLPKYLKSRPQNNNNNNNNNDIKHGKVNSNTEEKDKKKSSAVMNMKKNTDVCKKLLDVPHIARKNLEKPKIPHLQTAIRAQLRKRFDDIIREKERQNEQLKQMEIAAIKKQEEEERLYLRKQTVHKPQPIRKYKLGLPNVAKRPLTDPVTPILLKRRRTVDRVKQNNFRVA